MTPHTSLTWDIKESVLHGQLVISFCRPWETERHFLRVLDADQVRSDLDALEEIDRAHPGWYVGFLIRPTPVSHLDGLWAQYPGVTVVHAETPPDLTERIRTARDKHGL